MENKELFTSELLKGYLWQLYVAEQFRQLGAKTVDCPPLAPYKGWKHSKEHANSADIVVNGHIIEVKSRDLVFTSAEDFPFDTVAVETKQGFEAKTDKPVMYVTVCQHNGALIALDVAKTRDEWEVKRRFDTKRRIAVVSFDCRRELWENFAECADRLVLGNSDV